MGSAGRPGQTAHLFTWDHANQTRCCDVVLIIELTVPWEEGIPAANKFKWLKYFELAADCREAECRRLQPCTQRKLELEDSLRNQLSNSFVQSIRLGQGYRRPSKSWQRKLRSRVTGCGNVGGMALGVQHPNRISCREWWGDTPIWLLPGNALETKTVNNASSWRPCGWPGGHWQRCSRQ